MLCAHKNKHTQVSEEKHVSRYYIVSTKALNVLTVYFQLYTLYLHFKAVVVRNSFHSFSLNLGYGCTDIQPTRFKSGLILSLLSATQEH